MKDTRIGEVLGYRTYEKPIKYKTPESYETAEHNRNMKLKSKYSLPLIQSNYENGFDKMWNFLEKKAGDKK